ncbi:PHP domain protein [Isosphaera pallida ATCC 43644]|uniref:PHP domain protein n=1 Tax=Isosphaera pallida (strain ATCC 43644 / DSM 9630 / IS1B) TaxID=575540 RepID=E8QXF4_ISOPI|nr:DNA polymerase/3'-5' exonuclease PolX [Isosphaera pallida]ADV61995.1 PHP domain protein [Isosphaera pallida ATCC 43644]
MDGPQVARALREMGVLLELRGENAFRCKAYYNAADALRGIDDLAEKIKDGGKALEGLPGLGSSMLRKVAQLALTGQLAELDELRRTTPPGLLELYRVPGLGPSKIKALREGLQIESLAALKTAAQTGQLARLKGFGPKSQASILEAIAFLEQASSRCLLDQADGFARALSQSLASCPLIDSSRRLEPTGELRRRVETIGAVELLAVPASGQIHPAELEQLHASWARLGWIRELRSQSLETPGPPGSPTFELGVLEGRVGDGVPIRLILCPRERLGWTQLSRTGPDSHVAEFLDHAARRGRSTWPIDAEDEATIHHSLDLPFIPPELRDQPGVVARAARGLLPRLVTLSDLRGVFHCHTDWSDGAQTLDQMAQAARDRGFHYLGVADHSQSAFYANGLSPERVHAQAAAIDQLNTQLAGALRLFKGIESDILAEGQLDYADELLRTFDYVVVSVHSSFRLRRDAQTERLIQALRHPNATILGHPTGRLLLAREGYAVDLDRVLEEAARLGKVVEINANPHRLDLDAAHARRAKELGLLLAINPDAHSIDGLDDVRYGVDVARRAGLEPGDLLNTLETDEVAARLAALKRLSGSS